MLDEWIDKKYLEERTLSNANWKFLEAKPFQHILLKNFLNEKKAETLAKELKKEKFQFKDSDLFQLYQTENLHFSKNKTIKEFYEFVASEEFSTFISSLTGTYLKKGAIDLAGSLYKKGNYLLCHDDKVEKRKIAYIVYLSENFTEKDGANFVLFDSVKEKPHKEIKKFPPEWNSIMIFKVSDKSFHSVEENFSNKDRYAIGGWLH